MSSSKKGNCCSCLMSRRCFLGAAAAAAAAPMLAGFQGQAAARDNLGEYIDMASLRPRPAVNVASAVVRRKPPYWLGWPGTAYDLEGHRQRYCAGFAQAARRVGVTLAQKEQPLEDDAAVAAFVSELQAQKPDAVLIMLQHFDTWHWADAIAKAGIPTIVFAPVGMAFTMHVLEISRRPGLHVISSLELAPVEQALRAVRARKQMEAARLLIVAGNDSQDGEVALLGTKLRRVPRNTLHELFDRMPENDEVHDAARHMRRRAEKVVEPTRTDTLNAARTFTTAKRLLKDHECNGLTTDCLGMVTERKVPTPPCMAATMFQDGGLTYGCEADLNAALSLMLVSYLFDKPGFMQDPVPETYKNVLIGAHCSSGTRLNGFNADPEPYILRSHSESNLGVATQVLWKEEQPVTLVLYDSGNKQLLLDSGTVVGNVQTPPAGGCRTSVEIAMDRVEDVRDVKGFHQVIFYGNHRRDVEAFCQLFGIPVLHSPEHAPEPTQA